MKKKKNKITKYKQLTTITIYVCMYVRWNNNSDSSSKSIKNVYVSKRIIVLVF